MIFDNDILQILLRSIYAAIITSIGATYLGCFIAWLNYKNYYLYRIARYFIVILYFIPAQIYILSIIQNLSLLKGYAFTNNMIDLLYSYSGIIVVSIILNIPISFLMFEANLKYVDDTFIKLAYVSRATNRDIFVKIILPLLKPTIYKIKFLIFISCFSNLSIPYILGRPKQIEFFVPYLVNKLKSSSSYTHIDIYCILLVSFILIVLSYIFNKQHYKSIFYNGAFKAYNSNISLKIDHSLSIYIIFRSLFIWGFIILIIILPLVILVLNSFVNKYHSFYSGYNLNDFGLQNYYLLFSDKNLFVKPILRTLITSIMVFVLLFSTGLFLEFLKMIKKNSIIFNFIGSLGATFYTLPSIFIAILVIYLFPGSEISFLHLQLNLSLVFAYLLRFYWPMNQIIATITEQLPVTIFSITYLYTNNNFLIFFRIYLPLVIKIAIPAFLFILIAIFKELNISILLTDYNNISVPPVLFNLFESGEFNLASAYAVVLLVLICLCVFTMQLAFSK